MPETSPTSPFRCEIADEDGLSATLRVEGEIDVATVPALRECILSCMNEDVREIHLDFDGVSFIDTTGLGELVAARRHLSNRGGRLVVVRPQPRFLRLLNLKGLEQVVEVNAAEPEQRGKPI